ncbi:MAG: hypothetical protein MOGDAGHF_00225 [Rhodocyclaceae bacterium]|nr:hypothetical protein [Rhodocyclaceae bacterium]
MAVRVEQIAEGLAIRPDAGADGGAALQHAHRVTGRRNAVHFDVVLGRLEILLLHLRRQAAFLRHGEAGGHLHRGCAGVQVAHRIRAGEDAAGRYHGDGQLLLPQPVEDFRRDGAQIVPHPVFEAEAEVAAGERPLHHNVVWQPPGARALAQEQLQRAQRRDDDAKLDVLEARMLLDQCEGAQVQAGGERDAVDAGVHGRREAHAQRLLRRVHGELLHAVDENQPVAALGLHRRLDMQPGRLGHVGEIELHLGLVDVGDVVLVALLLDADELGVVAAVGHRLDHRVGNVADAAQPRRFQRQFRRGDIHAHAADHDRHQLPPTEPQAEIIHAFH